MNQTQETTQSTDQRLTWVEPAISQLEVKDTAYNPKMGGDGNLRTGQYPDCTKS